MYVRNASNEGLEKEGVAHPVIDLILKYQTLPPPKRPKKVEEVEFLLGDKKARALPLGKLAAKFGGLLDREGSKQDLYDGLSDLASKRGTDFDKKELPILALYAPSENGKTEFLRLVFNNCCSFVASDTPGTTAERLLRRINEAWASGPREPTCPVCLVQSDLYLPGRRATNYCHNNRTFPSLVSRQSYTDVWFRQLVKPKVQVRPLPTWKARAQLLPQP